MGEQNYTIPHIDVIHGTSVLVCNRQLGDYVTSQEDISLDEVASEGTCWKEILAEYECDICFEVLVGVHVLGERA